MCSADYVLYGSDGQPSKYLRGSMGEGPGRRALAKVAALALVRGEFPKLNISNSLLR